VQKHAEPVSGHPDFDEAEQMAAATQPKIFKKIEVIEDAGHHGGGWKVAYADFMTAMMAFFLLMWILSSSDEQKLRGIAEYFTTATLPGGNGVLDGATLGPPGTLTASNGSVVARGAELGLLDDPKPEVWEVRDKTTSEEKMETLALSGDEAEKPTEQKATATEVAPAEAASQTTAAAMNGEAETESDAARKLDAERFEAVKRDVVQAMQANPDLTPLVENVIFEDTPEGLYIQIVDSEGKAMFRSGRAEVSDTAATLMSNLGQSLSGLPNEIVLAGHTDAVPFAAGGGYDNWDLSSDRANVTRRVFESAGVDRSRIIRVSGLAETQPLVPEDPTAPSNRRISVLLRYQDEASAPAAATPPAPVQETKNAPEQPVQEASLQKQPATLPAQADQEELFRTLRSALR
jgi:chemotaxis protein MotB